MSLKRVFLVDDEPMLREGYKDWLEYAGHQVVLEASSLTEATGKLDEFEAMGVDVAVLDGNLSKGDKSGKDD